MKRFIFDVDVKNEFPGSFQVPQEVLVKKFCRRFEGMVVTIGTTKLTITRVRLAPERPQNAPG